MINFKIKNELRDILPLNSYSILADKCNTSYTTVWRMFKGEETKFDDCIIKETLKLLEEDIISYNKNSSNIQYLLINLTKEDKENIFFISPYKNSMLNKVYRNEFVSKPKKDFILKMVEQRMRIKHKNQIKFLNKEKK